MMLAEISQMEVWMLISQIVIAVGTIGALLFMAASFNKKTNVAFKQPVSVTISEELHNVFASKTEFEKHLADFKEKHKEVWATLRGENQRISSEVTATREAIAGLESTTGMQNQQLAAIQSDIKRLLEKR
jgi:flagellar motility protein MotE (MotC chaperone)